MLGKYACILYFKMFEKIKDKSCFVAHENCMKLRCNVHNYLLLEPSHTHSFPYFLRLFLHYKGRVNCSKDHMTHKAKNICYLAFYKNICQFLIQPFKTRSSIRTDVCFLYFIPESSAFPTISCLVAAWCTLNKNLL